MLLQLSNFLLLHCSTIQYNTWMYTYIHIHVWVHVALLQPAIVRQLHLVAALSCHCGCLVVVVVKKDINCYFITAMSSLKFEIDL